MQNSELYRKATDEILLRYSDEPDLKIMVDSIDSDNASVANIKLQSKINNLKDKGV
jgi:hypothetical protein